VAVTRTVGEGWGANADGPLAFPVSGFRKRRPTIWKWIPG